MDSKIARLLVVEDEEDLREILGEQLRAVVFSDTDADGVTSNLELKVDFAENGAIALKKSSAQWYDAVLSDINMPQMTGLEFLAEFRAAGKDTPVIFLTAFGDKAKAVEALRLGSYDFLDKPWRAENLRRVVLEALQLGFKQRQLEVELDKVLEQYSQDPTVSSERLNQLRIVHRSLLLLRQETGADSKSAKSKKAA